MAFFNKAVLSVYRFDYAISLLLAQLVLTVVLLNFFKYIKLMQFEDFNLHDARRLAIVSFLYALNVGISLSALSKLNIPMHSALKRLTILVTLVGERHILHIIPSTSIQVSVVVIVIGALVAGLGDLEFSLTGYIFAGISCLVQAAFLILLKVCWASYLTASVRIFKRQSLAPASSTTMRFSLSHSYLWWLSSREIFPARLHFLIGPQLAFRFD